MKSKLMKIKAMAERGTVNERKVASRMLDELLEKYNLTKEDLQSDEKRLYWIVYSKPYEKDLIFQIAFYVLRTSRITWTKRKSSKRVGLELTPSEYATIRDFWDTYRKPLRTEIESYLSNVFAAFVAKHELFGPKSTGESDNSLDMDLIRALMQKMSTIQKPHKQLTE